MTSCQNFAYSLQSFDVLYEFYKDVWLIVCPSDVSVPFTFSYSFCDSFAILSVVCSSPWDPTDDRDIGGTVATCFSPLLSAWLM